MTPANPRATHRRTVYARVDEDRVRRVLNPATGHYEAHKVTVRRYRPWPGAVSLKAFARTLGLRKGAGRWTVAS